MEKCFDIKNNEITQFELGNDGIVYGLNSDGRETLNSECCIRMGYEFDSDLAKCYWSKPCDVDSEIKILISPEGEDGVLFSIDDDETCKLDIEFDYLFEFKCSDLLACQSGLLEITNLKSMLNYNINSNSLQLADNEYQISLLEEDLRFVIGKTNENVAKTKESIDSLNLIIKDNNILINDYTVKSSYTDNKKIVSDYQDKIDTATNTVLEAELKIIELNKEIEGLNSIVKDEFSKYYKKIDGLKFENIKISNEIRRMAASITEVNLDISNYSILNLLTKPKVRVTLEKFDENSSASEDVNFENSNRNITVLEETLYEISNPVTFFDGNITTGIFFNDDNMLYCDTLNNLIVNDMGTDASVLNPSSFNSPWLHFSLSITGATILNDINNKKIKLGIIIEDNACEMSVLIDNIKFNKICETIEYQKKTITSNPSFELGRVIDNKKSWVVKEVFENREFDLLSRETSYNINHHKLGINSKEVEINISAAAAIESDVIDFIIDNNSILGSFSGLLTTNIFNNNITKEEFINILYSELIDAKDRQTIRDYPVLRALYNNYLNSLSLINVTSSSFRYLDMSHFIKLVGDYWVDLIEQVIPSTTIWGSTYKYNNTVFDNNKFKYKKGTLFTCSPKDDPLPLIGYDQNVDVIIETLNVTNSGATDSITDAELLIDRCEGVYMVQINDGSEFIGSVKIINSSSSENTIGNDVIILNESQDSIVQKIN